MPRARKKKLIPNAMQPSPHVINLRGDDVQHEASSVSEMPVIESVAVHTHEPEDFLEEWKTEMRTTPRVDFAHGMQVTTEVCVAPEREGAQAPSRLRRAFHDLAFVEILRGLGLPQLWQRVTGMLPLWVQPTVPVLHVEYRSVVVFAVIAGFLVLPFGAFEFLGRVREARAAFAAEIPVLVRDARLLMRAVTGASWSEARTHAQTLEHHFTALESTLAATAPLLRQTLRVLPVLGPVVESGESIVAGGAAASRDLGALLAIAAEDHREDVGSLVHRAAPILDRLSTTVTTLEEHIGRIRTSVFDSGDALVSIEETMRTIAPELGRATHGLALADAALGFDAPRRYLVLFQNPHELRATGGFLGSYAMLDVADGRVTSWMIPSEGTYGLQGQLAANVIAPRPLHIVNTRWEFQDANWWPDWPTTAEKILWFWEKSGQPTVDGVVVVNGNVLEDVLEAIGPLTLGPREGIVTSNSILRFIEETIVGERKNQNRRQPKRILGVLAERLMDRFSALTTAERAAIGQVILERLNRNDIMLYSRNTALDQHIRALGWDGRRTPDTRDTLMVVHSNIRGEKTDAVMDNALAYDVFVQPDGSAIATVTVERTHRGQTGDILSGAPNVDYVRVYVPEGSQLIDAWGWQAPAERLFEDPAPLLTPDPDIARIEGTHTLDPRTGVDVYTERGQRVFAHWLITRQGARSSAGIRYLLPFRLTPTKPDGFFQEFIQSFRNDPAYIPYDLRVTRQPGTESLFTSTMTTPATWESVWRYPFTTETSPATIRYTGELNDDLWIGAVWKQ